MRINLQIMVNIEHAHLLHVVAQHGRTEETFLEVCISRENYERAVQQVGMG